MESSQLMKVFRETVEEAGRSEFEDSTPHPYVGALLTDHEGRILIKAHRGERAGVHAEFLILEKAQNLGIDLRQVIMFVTFEPCIKRGPGKTPCAIRIAAANIPLVYIGTLDPNPDITGRGETYLSYHTSVERFPGIFATELRNLNRRFFDLHQARHINVASVYAAVRTRAGEGPPPKPALFSERQSLLQQTMDLISGSNGDIWISSGDLSWFGEMQVSILRAALDSRNIRILSSTTVEGKSLDNRRSEAMHAAVHLGAAVAEVGREWVMLGTMVSPGTDDASMVFIERDHASLLRMPEDARLLTLIAWAFEQAWWKRTPVSGVRPVVEPVSFDEIIAALRRCVPQYTDLKMHVEKLLIDELYPLPKALERFKLFRLHQLEALRSKHSLPANVRIVGSPWPITPPIVERLANGQDILVDGAHRAYAARARGESTVEAIVINNPWFNLPARPVQSWDEIRVYAETVPRSARYVDYKPENFRPIAQAFRYLASGLTSSPSVL